METYWLITVQDVKGMVATYAVTQHPTDWMAQYGSPPVNKDALLFAMPLTKAQYDVMITAGFYN